MGVAVEMKPLFVDTEQEAEYNVDRSQGLPQKDSNHILTTVVNLEATVYPRPRGSLRRHKKSM